MAQNLTVFQLLRRYFLTGIVVIAPVGVTAFVLYWIFTRLDSILGRLFNVIGIRIPGLGFVVLVAIVIGVGWLAHQALGREFITISRNWLTRFPLTRTIYSAASQIVEQIVGEERAFFKATVLVEYPRPGCWAIGFLTSEAAEEISETAQAESVAVFLPTTPNPTSGYIVFLPRTHVRNLGMTVEEGFKLVVSAGAVTPELVEGLDEKDVGSQGR